MKKTLFATDGSAFSRMALAWIAKLPVIREGEVLVANVVTPPVPMVSMVDAFPASTMADTVESVYKAEHEHADTCVGEALTYLNERGIKATGIVLEGEAVEELIRVIEQEKVDIVAVGCRDISSFEAFLLGSVSKELVNRAPCSVFIAHSGQDNDPLPRVHALEAKEKPNVAVGFDGSPGSMAALEAVKEQGPGFFAHAFAVVAEPLGILPSGVEPAAFVAAYDDEHDQVVAAAKEGERLLAGVADEIFGAHSVGKPAEALTRVAQEHDIDLIVLSATRHGFLENLMIGSTSAALAAHAPCAVWIVRPGNSA